MTSTTPLADDLIDMVMLKLKLTYGKRFTEAYTNSGEEVRAHWAHELAGLSVESIKHALQRLPVDYPPNVLQFRLIATSRPDTPLQALPAPLPSSAERERLREALRTATKLLQAQGPGDPIGWAVRIWNNPEGKSRYARKMAEDVLRTHGRIQ